MGPRSFFVVGAPEHRRAFVAGVEFVLNYGLAPPSTKASSDRSRGPEYPLILLSSGPLSSYVSTHERGSGSSCCYDAWVTAFRLFVFYPFSFEGPLYRFFSVENQ
jgi:hypothetical protein